MCACEIIIKIANPEGFGHVMQPTRGGRAEWIQSHGVGCTEAVRTQELDRIGILALPLTSCVSLVK